MRFSSKIRQARSGNQKWLEMLFPQFFHQEYVVSKIYIKKSATTVHVVLSGNAKKIYEDRLASDAAIAELLLTKKLSDALFDMPNIQALLLAICHDISDTVCDSVAAVPGFKMTASRPSANLQALQTIWETIRRETTNSNRKRPQA
jgi:hypothetical protein